MTTPIHAESIGESARSAEGLHARVDAGWLFLVAGLTLIAAVVLLPAHQDVRNARNQRDAVLGLEEHRIDRLERHSRYLAALEQHDPTLIKALAAEQLNLVPVGHRYLLAESSGRSDVSVFRALEPPVATELALYAHPEPDSMLAELAMDDRARLWLIAGAGFCILIGLLPPISRFKR